MTAGYRDPAPHPAEVDVAQQLVDAEKTIAHLRNVARLAEQRAEYETRERVRLENAQHERWSAFTETRVELRAARERALWYWLCGLVGGLLLGGVLERWVLG